MPVVATRVGELPYIIEDGINGYIRDPTAPVEAFGQPLRSLLCASKRKKLGIAARKKVVEQFKIASMIAKYVELIEEI